MAIKKGESRKEAKPQTVGVFKSRLFGDVANKISQTVGRASAFMIAAGRG